MKLRNAKISILINRDHTYIELIDNDSSTNFAQVKLTPEQLSSALSRMSHTDCEISLSGMERVGKKMEVSTLEFEIPFSPFEVRDNYEEIHKIALTLSSDGWIPDNYYQRQNTFFKKEDKQYARTTIRRWIEIKEEN